MISVRSEVQVFPGPPAFARASRVKAAAPEPNGRRRAVRVSYAWCRICSPSIFAVSKLELMAAMLEAGNFTVTADRTIQTAVELIVFRLIVEACFVRGHLAEVTFMNSLVDGRAQRGVVAGRSRDTADPRFLGLRTIQSRHHGRHLRAKVRTFVGPGRREAGSK